MISVIDYGLCIPHYCSIPICHMNLLGNSDWLMISSVNSTACYISKFHFSDKLIENNVELHSKTIFHYLSKLGNSEEKGPFIGRITPLKSPVQKSKTFFTSKKNTNKNKSQLS